MNFLLILLSIKNLLTTIGIIVVVFYALRFLGRLLFPVIMKKAVNNMQEKKSQYQQHYEQRKPEGQVTVETDNDRKQSRSSNTEGEYIDFEEIE
jgi:hypothetical protein